MLLAWGSSSGGRCCHLMVTVSEVIAGQNSDVNPADALCRPLLPALRTVASMFLSSALRVVGVNLVSLSARKPFDSRQCRLRPGSELTHPVILCFVSFFFTVCKCKHNCKYLVFKRVLFWFFSASAVCCTSKVFAFSSNVNRWKRGRIDPETLEFFSWFLCCFFQLVLYCFLMWEMFYCFFLKKRKKRNTF